MFQIEEELKKLPAKPGVYLMHDERDEIIYVGKARIRAVLEDKGISQTWLAKKLGRSFSTAISSL